MSLSSQRSRRLWQRLGITCFGLLAAATVAVLLLTLWIRSYVDSTQFRQRLSEELSRFLKVQGVFLPFRLSGFSICSEGFEAHGGPNSLFTDFRAEQIRADMNPCSLFQRAWRIDQIQIQRLAATLRPVPEAPRKASAVAGSTTSSTATNGHRPVPSARVDLRRLTIRNTNVKWKGDAAGEIRELQLMMTPAGPVWNLSGSGGQLRQKDWPLLSIQQFKARYQQSQLQISEAKFRVNDQGQLDATGEVRFAQGPRFDFDLKLNGIPITPFLPEDWRARVTGNLVGNAKASGPFAPSESIEASGTLALANARVEALPILERIAVLARTKPLRQIAFQRASADFAWKDSKLTVTDFVAESRGFVRIEGAFVIDQKVIDGTFRVGVTPATLQWLPGAQAKVFTSEEAGYFWAPLHLKGPMNHPQEDLTPQLLAAAKDTLVEGAKGAIERNAQGVIEFLKPLLR